MAGTMRGRALRGLGTISYCVCLIRLTINQFAHLLFVEYDFANLRLERFGVTLLSFATALGVATLPRCFFEKPLIKRGDNYHC